MPAIGDIVELATLPGQRWVVAGPALNAIPPNRLWYLLRRGEDGLAHAHVAGDGDLIPVSHPTFAPQQVIDYGHAYDGKATVLSDDGGDTVKIQFVVRRPRSLDREVPHGIDGATFTTMEIDAHRGQLVSMNLEG